MEDLMEAGLESADMEKLYSEMLQQQRYQNDLPTQFLTISAFATRRAQQSMVLQSTLDKAFNDSFRILSPRSPAGLYDILYTTIPQGILSLEKQLSSEEKGDGSFLMSAATPKSRNDSADAVLPTVPISGISLAAGGVSFGRKSSIFVQDKIPAKKKEIKKCSPMKKTIDSDEFPSLDCLDPKVYMPFSRKQKKIRTSTTKALETKDKISEVKSVFSCRMYGKAEDKEE
jgi:hypothetical protein